MFKKHLNIFKGYLRAFCRKQFLKNLPKDSVGAELGVFRGEFTKHILQIVQPRELHLVDVWWTRFGEFYPDWGEYTNFGKLSTKRAFESAQKTVQLYGPQKNCVFFVGDDLEYLRGFADSYFDWIYLDTTHAYEHTKLELKLLARKIKPDGLIMGHDWYKNSKHPHHGVYKAVNEFCLENNWTLVALDQSTQWCIKRV
jgi:SAM-dependent methyltransferase